MDRELMDWENEGGASNTMDAAPQEPTPTMNRPVYDGGPSWIAEVASAWLASQ